MTEGARKRQSFESLRANEKGKKPFDKLRANGVRERSGPICTLSVRPEPVEGLGTVQLFKAWPAAPARPGAFRLF